ncbi:MAG: YHS domain-containing protein [Pedobacter sp.]|nr:MAG: YHS domain-containing protein [Pedobacter sp.]
MKIIISTLITAVILFANFGIDKQQNKSKELTIDPVCKMKIDPKSKTIVNYVYEKIEYTFCSDVCKKSFIKKPIKYIKKQK